ncbi:MAG: M48 family metallopeptidase [Rhodospirillaceae bacterium]|nr:M48 family metallopeptidase [Rhodospirillaceae bacterium]
MTPDDIKAAELAQHLKAALGDLADRIATRINPRARRISLRLDPAEACIVLVRPRGVSAKAATRFAVEKRYWIEDRLADLPPRIVFKDGVSLPYLGVDHIIRHAPEARRGVWREDGVIFVSGAPEHLSRRVTDWLKTEAKSLIGPRARGMAEALGCKVARVTVRDTRSRWGSCSADGKLSFSWRLILAPEAILTYVAAHEVAHLKYLDHSKAFWRTVGEALAAYGGKNGMAEPITPRSAREWLHRSGAALHAYG